jgi:hypothetical protein
MNNRKFKNYIVVDVENSKKVIGYDNQQEIDEYLENNNSVKVCGYYSKNF